VADPVKTRLTQAERAQLAQQYAPILVLRPNGPPFARPRGRDPDPSGERGDYHPRPVDFVLDHAYVYPGWRGNLKNPRRFLHFNQGHPWIRHLPDFLRRRFPEPSPDARAALRDLVRGDTDIARAAVLDLIGIGRSRTAAQRAWQRYLDILESRTGDRYRPRIYARVLQGDQVIEWTLIERLRWYSRLFEEVDAIVRASHGPFASIADTIEDFLGDVEESISLFTSGFKVIDGDPRDVAVQYWFMYYYNDWYNRHEVDWEGMTIILRAGRTAPVVPEALTPEIAGYATHVSGRRRPWINIETEGDHPVVYCARGSHASYFNYRPDGYGAGYPVSITIPWVNVSIQLQLRRGESGYRDWVPHRNAGPGRGVLLRPERDYDVQLLPRLDPRQRRFSEEDLASLAWLIYPGLWGERPLFSIGGSGPHGPLWQGLKSDNPFAWVQRECVADDAYSP
jgi:hypothetical protein